MKKTVMSLFAVCLLSIFCAAQDVQVSRTNKTIAVTADESISVAPDIATVKVGYHAYAPTQQDAYTQTIQVSDRILKAVLASGVSEGDIETETLRVNRIDPDSSWTPEMKAQRQFEAGQSWKLHVRASDAQAIVDIAMHAGANSLDGVEWDVAEPAALQAKAGGAALAKARAIADQMAKGLGSKLGELVYASNRAPVAKLWRGLTASPQMASISSKSREEQPKLKLYPEKVKQDATVHAVFAIE
jgi:hypothetical protein